MNNNRLRLRILPLLIALTTAPFLLLLLDGPWPLAGGSQFWYGLASNVGAIAGFIGAALLLWQFLLGVRPLARRLSVDQMQLLAAHKTLGIYGLLLIAAHPALEMIAYWESWLWLARPDFSHWFNAGVTYGRMALYLLLLVWASSAVARRYMKWRHWKTLHLAAYGVMAAALVHAATVGSYLNGYWGLKALWAAWTLGFSALAVFRALWFFGVGKRGYEVTSVVRQPGDILLFKLKPVRRALRRPQPGQYAYVQRRRGRDAKPFSVMGVDDATGELTFGVKAGGSYTRRLLASLAVGERVFVDGPYGVFTREAGADRPTVIIAGGIGVTPFLGLVESLPVESTYMLHCNRRLAEAVGRDRFKARLGGHYVDVVDQEQVAEGGVVCGRLDDRVVRSRIDEAVLARGRFFLCGSPGFMKAVTAVLERLGVGRERIFTEEFSF